MFTLLLWVLSTEGLYSQGKSNINPKGDLEHFPKNPKYYPCFIKFYMRALHHLHHGGL